VTAMQTGTPALMDRHGALRLTLSARRTSPRAAEHRNSDREEQDRQRKESWLESRREYACDHKGNAWEDLESTARFAVRIESPVRVCGH
jgi:hypothetical protein